MRSIVFLSLYAMSEILTMFSQCLHETQFSSIYFFFRSFSRTCSRILNNRMRLRNYQRVSSNQTFCSIWTYDSLAIFWSWSVHLLCQFKLVNSMICRSHMCSTHSFDRWQTTIIFSSWMTSNENDLERFLILISIRIICWNRSHILYSQSRSTSKYYEKMLSKKTFFSWMMWRCDLSWMLLRRLFCKYRTLWCSFTRLSYNHSSKKNSIFFLYVWSSMWDDDWISKIFT
jgi:hypothetical protein